MKRRRRSAEARIVDEMIETAGALKNRALARKNLAAIHESEFDYRVINRMPLTLRVEDRFDFWPSTGKAIELETKEPVARCAEELLEHMRKIPSLVELAAGGN